MHKTMRKVAEIMASIAMKSAKGTCREVSREGMCQPKRPKALN